MTATQAVSRGSLSPPVISDSDFARFIDFFYRQTGIRFTEAKRYFVDRRLQQCILDAGERTFVAWFATLRFESRPEMLQQLINQFTINETYFLRENHQFDCLVDSALPAVVAQRRGDGTWDRTIRILSLPCSTGEEPYSIALRLLEDWPDIDTVNVEITAADIDTAVLAAAREGRYGARSLQRVPPEWLARHFRPDGFEHHQISAAIRSAIDFRELNIADPAGFDHLGPFDVVFCRNVLIYFDQHSIRAAAENIFGALRPGGFLFLGHSESMSRVSGVFHARRYPEGMAYQRPTTGATP